VLQAKFRQRPEGPSSDGKWLLNQLRTELAAFTRDDSPRRAPEQYLLITNVVLTSVQDAGSKDAAFALLRDSPLELSGYDIWDYDKLRALLDDAPDIARTYGAWITTGDVLHSAIASLGVGAPDFERTLARYLQSEILSDQYANLEQAGHSPDDRVPMASVFVDLPVSNTTDDDPDDCRLFVAEVLAEAAERLAASCTHSADTIAQRPSRTRGRIALIGGPGQGKTTLGQFACQLFRAALIVARPPESVEPEALAVANVVREWCGEDGSGLPVVRRFPLRVSLSEFAVALDRDVAVESVLSYLTARIAQRTSSVIHLEVFREWLGRYPWFLVLDGLDEVPASSNREAVLTASPIVLR
jgi:hypothetical protein